MNIFCKIGLNILSMNNYTRIYIILNKNEDKYKISHNLTWFSCFILDFFFFKFTSFTANNFFRLYYCYNNII